jgi:3-hydroxyacyl-[acyl-carrier-protein] dehydratase
MQAGGVLLAERLASEGTLPVVTRMNDVKFKMMVRPGDTVDLEVDLVDRMTGVYFLAGRVSVGGKLAVTFNFACKATRASQ